LLNHSIATNILLWTIPECRLKQTMDIFFFVHLYSSLFSFILLYSLLFFFILFYSSLFFAVLQKYEECFKWPNLSCLFLRKA